MSRRRQNVEKRWTELNIVCGCGKHLGKVVKQPIRHVNPYRIQPPLEFVDLPEPTPTSGKVVRKCPECGRNFERRWDGLRALLDDTERTGRAAATVRG